MNPEPIEQEAPACKHGAKGYCFDCVRERHNQEMLDGKYDEEEIAPAKGRIPLPTEYVCIAPKEFPQVLDHLLGRSEADRLVTLHLELCARCRELAGWIREARADERGKREL